MNNHGVPIDRATIERLAKDVGDSGPYASLARITLLALRDALDAAREKALEEAAQLMEREAASEDPDDLYTGRRTRATSIRALKTKE